MPAITPQFVFDLESRMRIIVENEYLRMSASDVLWWDKLTKVIPSGAGREIFTWILNTAQLEKQGKGGEIEFEDMLTQKTEYISEYAGKGLRLKKSQFEDLDGNGLHLATEWSKQMGAQHGYWPQSQIAQLLKDGETGKAYDGKNFFAADHFTNGVDVANGIFANLFTGAASGVYPGACPIDESVTLDVAVRNLGKVYAYIGSLKMPNGKTPRFLRPKGILCAPQLMLRASQVTDAKFIAMAAASGGGSADMAGIIKKLGFGEAWQADELADFESGTTYFVVVEQIASSEIGALAYVDREPFSIRFYSESGGGSAGVDAAIGRSKLLEWQTDGRNVAGYGHPYGLFKVKAA